MANNNHFELTLDTLAPSGSITRPALYMNANANLTIVKGDASFMKVWFNGNSAGTKSDATYPSSPEAAAETKMTGFATSGTYYYHMTLIDDVNNESAVFDTQEIIFDSVVPTISNIVLADRDSGSTEIANDHVVDLSFDYADNLSGVVQAIVSCEDWAESHTISGLQPSGTHYSGTLDFGDVSDGLKEISIVVVDQAGNRSAPGTQSITIDTSLTKPTLVLKTPADAVLPSYINYHTIKARLTSNDTDINGYKIWEGSVEPSEYTAHTPGSALDVTLSSVNLSSGDGLKTMHAKVRDVAGNETSADDVTVTIDTVLPTVSISSDRSIISNVTGYATAVLTLGGSDAAGIASYALTYVKNGSPSTSGTITNVSSLPTTKSITSADLGWSTSANDGTYTLTLTVVDNAGNSNSATCNVIVDTTAPTITLTSPINVWHNSQFGVAVTLGDANAFVENQAKLWAWTDIQSSTENVPSGVQPVTEIHLGNNTIGSGSINWGLAQSEQNYLHIKLVDNVGNVAYLHEVFKYDSEIDDPTVAFVPTAVYNSESAQVRVSLGPDISGITEMRITGDITNGTADGVWETIGEGGLRSVTLTEGDGMKTVYVKVKDAAGNESNTVTATCELDETAPSVTLSLYEADGSTAKAARSQIATLSARITVTNDESLGGCEYKIYGDFTFGSQSAQGIDEESAAWTTFTPDSGVAYKLISDMYCTSGDGQKNINVKIKDNAGNVTQATQSFYYDTTAIDVEVSGIDYNRVSKIHALRRSNGGEISGHYADECNFEFAPQSSDDFYQAYKVVAYSSAEAAAAGSHLDDPIKQSGDAGSAGSVHMHATGLSQNTTVSAMIKGADLEAAVNDGEDGIKIIVVYMQDLAGQWSEAANFEVSL